MTNVLIIEDDRYFTEDLAEYLSLEDIKYQIVNSAEGFMDIKDNLRLFDFVLLDIMMRRGVGFSDDTARETGELIYDMIREQNPELPIIVISAKNKGEIDIDFENPFTDYIPKPLGENITDLLYKLRNA